MDAQDTLTNFVRGVVGQILVVATPSSGTAGASSAFSSSQEIIGFVIAMVGRTVNQYVYSKISTALFDTRSTQRNNKQQSRFEGATEQGGRNPQNMRLEFWRPVRRFDSYVEIHVHSKV
jgi:hypothetical protein